MYRNHFGLHEKPFQIVPSPKYLFYSETHDESRARMLYGIREGRGFVVITGAIGLGKTTVLMSVLDELEQNVRSALIFNPVDSFHHLLRMMAYEFGFSPEGDEVSLMRGLNLFLVEAMARGENCVLLIDEAQNLSLELLEKIRLLSNLQTEQASLLQIVLVGQPELLDKLHEPQMVQLRQRVGVWFEIAPLTQEETEDYILHRLSLSGAKRPKEIFPLPVCRRVYDYARGVPRLINQIADTALVIAFGRNARSVGTGHVDEAAHELRLDTALGDRPIEKKPASPTVPRRSAPRASASAAVRRPPLTGTILVVLAVLIGLAVAIAGWRTGLFEPGAMTAGRDARGDSSGVSVAGINPETPAVEAAAPAPVAEETELALAEPPADPVLELARRLAAQTATVETWRNEGRVVYTVHLASFRSEDQARTYAVELLQGHPEWSEPVFVEPSGQDPTWYRVLGGGFVSREKATHWSRELKDQRGLSYAQVARLAARAEPVFEAEQGSTVERSRG